MTMPKREDLFPSRFLNVVDLKDEPAPVKIVSAETEMLRDFTSGKLVPRTVLEFENATKCLPLNKTNWITCSEICGEDTEDWVGKWIELYPDKTPLNGKMVDCIRIRAVTKSQAKKSAVPPKKYPDDRITTGLPKKSSVLPKNEPPQQDPDDPGPGDDDFHDDPPF
jgi:hypothetical protein